MTLSENRVSTDVRGLVSVIVPVYRAEGYLDRCVESVLAQTYHNLEVILVDDGSPDACPAMCDAWAARDGRVLVIHQENGGLSAARNAGLNCANGEFVFFLDSDDFITVDEIEILCEAMNGTGADMVVGGLCYVDGDGSVINTVMAPACLVDEAGYWHRIYNSPGDYVEYVVSCGKLFKRTAFRSQRFDEGKLHEDEFIIHRLVAQCSRIAFVGHAGYLYVQNEDSIMHNLGVKSLLDTAEAKVIRCKYLIDRGWYAPALAELAWVRRSLGQFLTLCEDGENERYERLRKIWLCSYRSLSFKGGAPLKQHALNLLFAIFPKMYSLMRGQAVSK